MLVSPVILMYPLFGLDTEVMEEETDWVVVLGRVGRQGFKEAQSFPGDFDGIVAEAPAIDFGNLQAWSGQFTA